MFDYNIGLIFFVSIALVSGFVFLIYYLLSFLAFFNFSSLILSTSNTEIRCFIEFDESKKIGELRQSILRIHVWCFYTLTF